MTNKVKDINDSLSFNLLHDVINGDECPCATHTSTVQEGEGEREGEGEIERERLN